jgi:hypothetical protein
MIPVPNLDDRTHKDIVEEALRLIPQYCPEWTNFNPSDPGVTLVELFAWMTEMAVYRLNKVTDKNFIAFLNMMGVKLQSPQPARALLQFKVAEKAPATWVRACTPVGTVQAGRDEPVIFETAQDLLVTSNHVARCFTQVSDAYSDQTAYLTGRHVEGFEVFGGVNHIERSLYIGDARLEHVGEESLLVVRIASHGHREMVDLLEWSYWNGRRWREMTPAQTEVEDGAIAFEHIDSIEETELNGIKARWIRGRLVESPPDKQETIIDSVLARVELLGEGVGPQAAYTNIDSGVFLNVDLQRAFAPLGREPRIDDAFYLLPKGVPSQPGSLMRVELTLADARQHDAPQPSEDLVLVWEYFDGKAWKSLGQSTPEGSISHRGSDFEDATETFTCSGEVRFRRPEDLSEVEIQGEPGAWIRVRVEQGDYGVQGQYELDGERWIWRDERPLRPPHLRGVTFRYSEQESAVTHVLTYNDFAFFDHSLTARTPLKAFQAFEPSTEDSPTLYLGFGKAFPNDPTRLYFQMAEETGVTRDRRHEEYLGDYYADRDAALAAEQRVIWEYWNGRDWMTLAVEDGSRAFTESGFVEFIGPEDHRPAKRFGEACHWLRCRLEMGGYHRMPRITHVLLNTVEAFNQATVTGEVLGTADGTPNQSFPFAQGPLLADQTIRVKEREAPQGTERMAVLTEAGEDAMDQAADGAWWITWTEVDSFYDSGPRSRHYVIDRELGSVRFGDGRKGMPPPAGSKNIMAATYRIGGGSRGNVTANRVTALRRSIAHIDGVDNPFPASGGSDQESVDDAKARGPHLIKSRNRAVTAEDFEWLTLQASNGIARARCINTIGREGEVTVVVVPKSDERRIDISQKLVPTTELLRRVKHFLDERRLLTTIVHVAPPRYVEISIRVEVIRKTSGTSEALRRAVEERLRTFLHPLMGGRDAQGWAFGRNVLKLDLYHVIEDVEGVDVVHRITLWDEDRRSVLDPMRGEVEQVKVVDDQLVHLVHVEIVEKSPQEFI